MVFLLFFLKVFRFTKTFFKYDYYYGYYHYSSQDVLGRTIRSEGFFSLWKGFTPYYTRLGPHTVLTFIFLEQFNRLYRENVMNKQK